MFALVFVNVEIANIFFVFWPHLIPVVEYVYCISSSSSCHRREGCGVEEVGGLGESGLRVSKKFMLHVDQVTCGLTTVSPSAFVVSFRFHTKTFPQKSEIQTFSPSFFFLGG